MRMVKSLLKKQGDPYLALLAHRATPLQCGYSPSELLMARKLHTTVPTTRKCLAPGIPDSDRVRERETANRNPDRSGTTTTATGLAPFLPLNWAAEYGFPTRTPRQKWWNCTTHSRIWSRPKRARIRGTEEPCDLCQPERQVMRNQLQNLRQLRIVKWMESHQNRFQSRTKRPLLNLQGRLASQDDSVALLTGWIQVGLSSWKRGDVE